METKLAGGSLPDDYDSMSDGVKQPRLRQSFYHAWCGVLWVARRERNFRVHLVATVLVLGVALGLGLDLKQLAILLLAIGSVLVAEAFNTAIEAFVDLLSPDYHPAAKTAKDVAAGATLLASLTAAAVGLCLLGPPLWRLCSAWASAG
jgi:undecaprenol kinase